MQIVGKQGILVNDALNIAAMKANKIFTAATNDRDFERVKEMKPR
jgi:predicted nucleic acid-binding protein